MCQGLGELDESEVHPLLSRALRALRARPVLLRYCAEEVASARHSSVFKAFLLALTHGGPQGRPRPMEVHAHNPRCKPPAHCPVLSLEKLHVASQNCAHTVPGVQSLEYLAGISRRATPLANSSIAVFTHSFRLGTPLIASLYMAHPPSNACQHRYRF